MHVTSSRFRVSGRFRKKVSSTSDASTIPPFLSPLKFAVVLVASVSAALAGCGTATTSSQIDVAPSAMISTSLFDFGNDLVNNTITQTVAVVTNTGSHTLTMRPVITGDPSFTIVSGQSCGSFLSPGAKCDMVVSYAPTAPSAPKQQDAVLNMQFGNVKVGTPQTVALTGMSGELTPGAVTATRNPQVALYTITLPFPGSVAVNFGTGTDYGLTTSAHSTDTNGQQVSIFVAGMRATTTYHMAATVQFNNGITATDTDHTFTTQALPSGVNLSLASSTPSGLTPQPGVEMLNSLNYLAVTDLSGNVLWTYLAPTPVNQSPSWIEGVKMLPNGDFLLGISATANPLAGAISSDYVNEIREVNLEGDTVRHISIADLNSELAAATCAECHVKLQVFHHDVTPLPNGHWLVLANTIMYLSSTTTPALTNQPAQNVLGDVIIDLDQNLHPVWAWNEFNHLDPNRQPMGFPDWTHTNAVIYSPDDGNILVSIRHQNWVVKVDYENGTGSGNILWRLGQGGDLALVGGTDPTDWEYAQHAPSFTSSNSTGIFSLTMMDNGDDRMFPAGVSCGTAGQPQCTYSTIPVFKIDETAKTATLTFHQVLPVSLFNLWGGNSEQLANGNIEYDLCGVNRNSYVYEVTQDSAAQTVWSMTSTGVNLYRAYRMPSLYPGVQW